MCWQQQTNLPCRKYNLINKTATERADLSSNIASTLQAGCFLGCFIASWGADKYGRKLALQVCGLITIIGCVIQAAASGSIGAMYVGRYVKSNILVAIKLY